MMCGYKNEKHLIKYVWSLARAGLDIFIEKSVVFFFFLSHLMPARVCIYAMHTYIYLHYTIRIY